MWRARVPPPAARRPGCRVLRAATISSRIGNSAARPRSRIDWPPILTTLTSGMTRDGAVVDAVGAAPVSVEPARRGLDGAALGVIGQASLRDDGADVLAGERARQLAAAEAVDDLRRA